MSVPTSVSQTASWVLSTTALSKKYMVCLSSLVHSRTALSGAFGMSSSFVQPTLLCARDLVHTYTQFCIHCCSVPKLYGALLLCSQVVWCMPLGSRVTSCIGLKAFNLWCLRQLHSKVTIVPTAWVASTCTAFWWGQRECKSAFHIMTVSMHLDIISHDHQMSPVQECATVVLISRYCWIPSPPLCCDQPLQQRLSRKLLPSEVSHLAWPLLSSYELHDIGCQWLLQSLPPSAHARQTQA